MADRRGADECWTWTGTHTQGGYGTFYWKPIKTTAHRAAYRLFVGPVVDELDIDHLCRNRGCVNPAHLEVVTHLVNARRSIPATGTRTTYGRKIQCKNGHPLVPYSGPDGRKRRCPVCAREAGRRFDARHPERALRRRPR